MDCIFISGISQNISILGPIIVSPGTGTMLDLQLGAVKNMETSDLQGEVKRSRIFADKNKWRGQSQNFIMSYAITNRTILLLYIVPVPIHFCTLV